jgi:hypothetical protein
MPNIKCEKCKKYLEDICKENRDLISFKVLLRKRIKFFGKIPYAITPGIHHNEITNNSNCDGVLYYKPFDKSPKNSTFEITMDKLNNILNDDTLLNQNIISNKSEKELKNNIIVNKRYPYIILFVMVVKLILFVINKI